MNCENPLSALEAQIRESVASGNYPQAGLLVSRYTREVEQNLRALRPQDPETSRIMHRAASLLEWVKRITKAQRAHAALQLQQLPNLAPFRKPGVRRLNTWTLEG